MSNNPEENFGPRRFKKKSVSPLPRNKSMPTGKDVSNMDPRYRHLTGPHTLYRPEFCDILVDLYRQHGSVMGVRAAMGISYSTYRNWLDKYPDFKDADERGRDVIQDIDFKMLKACVEDRKLNPVPLMYICSRVHKWRDDSRNEGAEPEKAKEDALNAHDELMKKHEKEY